MKISEMIKLTKHYDKYFRQTDAIVLHPCAEEKLHIDALLYKPTDLYPFWKLATMGAGDFAMNGKNSFGNRNEYMLFIDPSVDMEDKVTASKYYDILIRTALFPLENDIFISYGHSLEFADKNNAGVAGIYIEMPQAIEDVGILRCKLSLFKQVICLQVIPLNTQALNQLLKVGNEDFSFTYTYPEQDEEPHWLCKL